MSRSAPSGHSRLPAAWSARTIVIAGPTATGKSAVAVELARRLGGEIISVDSMQVYRGLDVGTAKPSAAQRAAVAHHLLDVVTVRDPFDAARFAALAGEAIADILGRGRLPILSGGTGLYFKALLEGFGDTPAADPRLRAALEATPLAVLLEELEHWDPVTFMTIDRRNRRRVVRALEVIRITGRPLSSQRAAWTRPTVPCTGPCFGLLRSRGDLRRRIEARVDEMFVGGLVAETQRLLGEGLAENRTALQAIGYRQVVEHLQGVRGLEATIALVKQRTGQLARRQMTWFRHQLALEWIPCEPEEPATAVAERLEERCRRNGRFASV